MNRFFRKLLKRAIGSGSLFKQILTLMSGTATAQIVTVLAMIPLARLYGPKDIGLYAIVQSVVAFGTSMASARYDIAIVLPRSPEVAQVLYRLASRLIVCFSILLFAGLVGSYRFVYQTYGDSLFAQWLPAASLVVLVAAQTIAIQYLLIRVQDFRAIARNRLIKSVAVAALQLTLAQVIPDFRGLLIGLVCGQLITLLAAARAIRGGLKLEAEELPSYREVASEYKKMPLLNGPNALLDSIQALGINLLIGNIAVHGLGQYSLAMQITRAPVGFLSSAISQVVLKRLSVIQPGQMLKFLASMYARILIFAGPVFIAFYVIAPHIFPLVFGEQWAEAGLIAQALVPWLFMLTLTSPLSSLFIVVNKQELSLAFSIISASLSLSFLAKSSASLLDTIAGLALMMAVLLLLWVTVALYVARNFDKRSGG